MKYFSHSVVVILVITLLSCVKGATYEKNYAFPNHTWKSSEEVTFEFNVQDTSTNYQLFLMLRHTEAYPFSNIWLQVRTTLPNGQELPVSHTEIPLAETSGKWLGRGMNEIWEHKMPLTRNGAPMHFNQTGRYKMAFRQIMRQNPLPEVMSIGLHVEREAGNLN